MVSLIFYIDFFFSNFPPFLQLERTVLVLRQGVFIPINLCDKKLAEMEKSTMDFVKAHITQPKFYTPLTKILLFFLNLSNPLRGPIFLKSFVRL